ncbi:hypothetical protein [Campylobacter ornithocola]|uniref:putative barnase/colicin E5 family endoribonuclease n=1 Tax=Campylobacter ornithocola TaxID=1848766 RepID=UPI00155DD7F8|nr:hypothetical protein [Campylobacter ornithocola]
MFKTKGKVARVIKEIIDNPNRYYKNDRLDISLIAKDLQDGKIGKMGIVNQGENMGKVGHLIVSSNKKKEINKLSDKNKKNLGVGSPTPTLHSTDKQGGQTAGANAHSLSSLNSTQDKPKENLIEKLKEDRKNNKSVKEKLDEKIKNQKGQLNTFFKNEYEGEKFEEDVLEDDFFNKQLKNIFSSDKEEQRRNLIISKKMMINRYKRLAKASLEEMEEYKGTEKEKTNFKHLKKEQKVIEEYREEIEQIANIKPLKEFGKNYAEYYHDGKGALQKLLIEKQGQVAGAFHRKDLGDIDLVWGEVTDEIKHKGYGLAHIIDKHPDFYVKMIDEIVEKGEVKKSHNGFNIIYKDYRLGLNEGWNEKGQKIGNNKWVVTAFEKI